LPPLWVTCNGAVSATLPKAVASHTHFHEKAIICQVGIGRAPWRSIDAAPLSFASGSVCALGCRSDESGDPHFHPHSEWSSVRPVHFEVRSFESWGCNLQSDLSSVSPVLCVSQSPAFEFPIHAAGNAVAFSFQDSVGYGLALLFPLLSFLVFVSCFVFRRFDHAAFVASAMLKLFRSGS
jgi:hypothetical protein